MAGLFDTSTDTMRSTSAKVLTDAGSIQSDLQGLLNRLMGLEGQWIGDGRVAFQSAESRYQSANSTLNSALTDIAELISANEARYTADDAQARSGLAVSAGHFDVPGF